MNVKVKRRNLFVNNIVLVRCGTTECENHGLEALINPQVGVLQDPAEHEIGHDSRVSNS